MNDHVKLAAVLAGGVVLPGVASYLVAQSTTGLADEAVWAGGYGLMVLTVWYTWIRPLDLSRTEGGTEP
ncbi:MULTISPECIES: hypothetical protein [Halobacterium]|uniref:Bacterioopsin-associated protein n=4 Tax=Halobacterium salinarum TaxID=2242 RepID=A0A510N7X7_HALSA|nr:MULTISPECIES: hypothetical protein [Halobacterium]MBB6089113.1 hypothetical protein [Halobacterium salinarum]MCF2166169.1 hypothetical protein [Halobacterium salinarum]MCF2167652.1 hypothetical protein [Halobacterium salinarum]MCF2207558.1 hypothetical protein [Halobacterium salinarum]MCF2237556.1 hypothetical protein [Halobacterium salinarum]